MYEDFARARSIADYRPYKVPTQPEPGSVPVYHPGLEKILAEAVVHPDSDGKIPHVMATCAGYAYAGFGQKGDPETVAMIMARMGLEENRCQVFEQRVDAMFIASGAYLVQSEDGRVVILCYRGTQPEDIISILTDADVLPEQIKVDLDDKDYYVHAGFYRNMRATRYLVIEALKRAVDGYSVERKDPPEKVPDPLEALYITGHSLGGAMAALMGVGLVSEPAYKDIADKLKAIYTFGQPMLGDQDFAQACENQKNASGIHVLRDNLIRYIYERDVVPHLPPRPVGPYASFGKEYRHEIRRGAIDNIIDTGGKVLEVVANAPTDVLMAIQDPVGAFFGLVNEGVQQAGNAVQGGVTLIHDVVGTTEKFVRNPRRAIGETWEEINKALAGSPGEWVGPRTDRVEQLQNLSGLTIVAPLAFLAKRLEWTRTLPFQYSFEDHMPNHYISTLAPAGVRSEFGDVR
jgi:hypothetical protein